MQSGTSRAWVGLAVALLTVGGAAHGQNTARLQSGGVAREAMYLRLFQEIDNFEAQADALESTGVQPTNLRSYHQKRLGLSEAHAVLLKQTALDCVRDLRSSGMLAQRGSARPPMPAAGTVRAGMARVSAAVGSLKAAMGPAEFAYFDSEVRRYLLTARPAGANTATKPTRPTAVAPPLSLARVAPADAGGGCGGQGNCPNADGEAVNNVTSGRFPDGTYGAKFQMYVYPFSTSANRTVSETLLGPDQYGNYNGSDGGYAFDTCKNSLYWVGPIRHSAPGQWQTAADANGRVAYTNPPFDSLLISGNVVNYYAPLVASGDVDTGCSIYVIQSLYIDNCQGGTQSQAYLGPGQAGQTFWNGDGGVAMEIVRQNGGGDVLISVP